MKIPECKKPLCNCHYGQVFEDSDGLYASNSEFIASFRNGQGDVFNMATPAVRAFIVRAVNSHEALLKHLKYLAGVVNENIVPLHKLVEIDNAIALAEGGK